MRLIDADELMKTLGITDMDCDKCAWHDREWSNCKRGGDFEDACCAIENAPTIEERKTGKWIPCSERLPEDGLYLVTTSKGQTQVHVFSHNGNSKEYWMRCNKAWMPLPEPYKERRTDD